MCLGQWSLHGYIHDNDVQEVVLLPEVTEADGDEDGDVLMPDGFNKIL